jgi:transaldolase
MMIALQQLAALGQTVWLDSISHDLINSGALTELISHGIRGGTIAPVSNAPVLARRRGGPSPPRYGGGEAEAALEARLCEDSRRAAEMLRAIYEQSRGQDGFAGVPIAAGLAHDPAAIVAEAQRLYREIARPNVMIEVPATAAGIAAVRRLVVQGISVQATLLFSLDGYQQVVDAYLDGLEQRAAAGQSLASVASVAGFAIGPLDNEVDRRLCSLPRSARGAPGGRIVDALRGLAALATAQVAYQHFRQRFTSARFATLRAHGAQVQRLLWAGTEVSAPGSEATRYVDALIGAETIAALSLPTLEAFEEQGRLRRMDDQHLEEAYATLHSLTEAGINLTEVADYLLAQGLRAAAAPFRQHPAPLFQQVALAGFVAPPGG